MKRKVVSGVEVQEIIDKVYTLLDDVDIADKYFPGCSLQVQRRGDSAIAVVIEMSSMGIKGVDYIEVFLSDFENKYFGGYPARRSKVSVLDADYNEVWNWTQSFSFELRLTDSKFFYSGVKTVLDKYLKNDSSSNASMPSANRVTLVGPGGRRQSAYDRELARAQSTGNKWALENFKATH